MDSNSKEAFIALLRFGIGGPITSLPDSIDWPDIQARANQHGLTGIILDGLEELKKKEIVIVLPEKRLLTQWIGEVLQNESIYAVQQKAAAEMALIFYSKGIRTYVLKGNVVSECYPKPEHRVSVDVDCFLLSDKDEDAWGIGNESIKEQGFEVCYDYYKNSTFYMPGLTVENHRFFTPFRGNKKLKNLERMLQSMMEKDEGNDMFEGTWLYRPPIMVTSLFLIEHAYSHFLHEGLTWRHVLDWMMFTNRHKEKIDWEGLNTWIDEFGFRKFYDSYYQLGKYLVGEMSEDSLTRVDKMMLEDVWSDLDLHETAHGVKGKLALVGNTLRARWKYRYFSDLSMLNALWIQVKGVLFMKEPQLQ